MSVSINEQVLKPCMKCSWKNFENEWYAILEQQNLDEKEMYLYLATHQTILGSEVSITQSLLFSISYKMAMKLSFITSKKNMSTRSKSML